MKAFLNILICLCALSPVFSQIGFPNTGSEQVIPSGTDIVLINDYRGLDFDKENAKMSFDFVEEETTGTIGGLDFTINFNPNDPENATFMGTALVKTIDTNNFLRDGHLMWEKFFYKRKHPKISFKSKQVVAFEKDVYKVIGNLTIKGVEKEIIITFLLEDKKLFGKATIYTSDFNVSIHDEREKNKLNIQFYFPIL